MSTKTFKIIEDDISDGYHTFDELYDHRNLLFLTWLVEERRNGGRFREVYWVRDHFPGWDLVATNVGQQQVSYHVSACYRDICADWFTERTSLEDVFDGHTSSDVADRLRDRLRV